MKKELSNKIYVYTFAMTIFVVIYHCSKWFMQDALGASYNVGFIRNFVYNFFNSTGETAVGFFFAISAYLFFRSEKSIGEKFKKRLKTLGIPFVFWNAVYLVLILAGLYSYDLNWPKSAVFGFTIYPFNGALWYCFVLLIFFCFAPLISKLRDKTAVLLTLIVVTFALAFCTSYCYRNKIIDFQYFDFIERMIRYIPIFLAGAALGMNTSIIKAFRVLGKGKLSFLWLAIYIASLVVITRLNNEELAWVFYRLSPLIIWNAVSENLFKRDVARCFKCTFLIYATHPFIVSYIRLLIQNKKITITTQSLSGVILFVIVNLVIVFVINVLLDFIIGKLPQKVRIMLTGGR